MIQTPLTNVIVILGLCYHPTTSSATFSKTHSLRGNGMLKDTPFGGVLLSITPHDISSPGPFRRSTDLDSHHSYHGYPIFIFVLQFWTYILTSSKISQQ